MKKHVIGFDFGTTNSTIGVASDKEIKLIPLGQNKIETRTALYYEVNKDIYISGDYAISAFKENPKGRLFQSPKSGLNSEKELETFIRPGKTIKITQIIQKIISDFKNKIEEILQSEIDSVVLGRPVKFHDTNKELDLLAQKRLENAARSAGFKNIEFEFEPNGALKNYLSTEKNNGNVLIVDIGGGTSDFSIVNTNKQGNVNILANDGVYIGGNKLDQLFSNGYFANYLGKNTTYNSYNKILDVPQIPYSIISDWKNLHTISNMKNINSIRSHYAFANDQEKYGRLLEIAEDNMKGYKYIDMIESGKKLLTQNKNIQKTADFFNNPFEYDVSRNEFNEIIHGEVDKIKKTIQNVLNMAGLRSNNIDKIYLTGGTSIIPYIQKEIVDMLGGNVGIIKGDTINSVGYGLTIAAKEKFL